MTTRIVLKNVENFLEKTESIIKKIFNFIGYIIIHIFDAIGWLLKLIGGLFLIGTIIYLFTINPIIALITFGTIIVLIIASQN